MSHSMPFAASNNKPQQRSLRRSTQRIERPVQTATLSESAAVPLSSASSESNRLQTTSSGPERGLMPIRVRRSSGGAPSRAARMLSAFTQLQPAKPSVFSFGALATEKRLMLISVTCCAFSSETEARLAPARRTTEASSSSSSASSPDRFSVLHSVGSDNATWRQCVDTPLRASRSRVADLNPLPARIHQPPSRTPGAARRKARWWTISSPGPRRWAAAWASPP